MKYIYSKTLLFFFAINMLGCASSHNRPLERVPAAQEELDPAVAQKIGDVFEQVMLSRKEKPTRRAVFLKPHGCAKAKFTVLKDLPQEFRVGLFAHAQKKDAWVRVSSDTIPQTKDSANSTIGFSVKVMDVPGTKVLPTEEEFTTQDFLLQNHHVFFVDTAQDFLEITENFFSDEYLNTKPQTKAILDAMNKTVENVLGTTYWSTTPYKFGSDNYAKYKIIPCKKLAPEAASGEPNYLRQRMERDLNKAPACFELQVQLKKGEQMPTDQATVEWDENVSVPQTVAIISIPKQNIENNNNSCEHMAFTAWHALPEHKPVGSINQARGYIYKRLSDRRRHMNNLPIVEPTAKSR